MEFVKHTCNECGRIWLCGYPACNLAGVFTICPPCSISYSPHSGLGDDILYTWKYEDTFLEWAKKTREENKI